MHPAASLLSRMVAARLLGVPRRCCSFTSIPEFAAAKRKLLDTYKEMNRVLETSDPGSVSSDFFSRWSRLRPIGEHLTALEFIDSSQKETADLLRELMGGGEEEDFTEMVAIEQREMEQQVAAHNEEVLRLLVPPDTYDECDALLEVSSGAGGQEAMLFAQELLDLYVRVAGHRGWSIVEMTENRSEIGGLRFGSLVVSGISAYRALKYEGGIHRVQRVPRTSNQGKIHTSTAAVAVIPRPDEITIELNKEDLKFDTYKSSGKGGQHVNTTDSAVRVTHLPTGVVAESQDSRSQGQNRDTAVTRLRIKLQDRALAEEEAARSAKVRLQVGGRNRSEKIRTYNFPQDRLTDHRISRSWSNLRRLMAEPGLMDEVLDALQSAAHADRLTATLRRILADGWQ